jgi:hypothetical protein
LIFLPKLPLNLEALLGARWADGRVLKTVGKFGPPLLPLELVNARIIQISDRQQVATAQGDYPGAWRNSSMVKRNSI